MDCILIAFIGVLGGVVGGLFGVGGGVIFVPLLILVKRLDPHLAIGTSLAVIVPTALIAAIRNYKAGMIDWKIALLLIVFSMIGSWAGAGLSLGMDVTLLKRFYAAFLLVLSLKLFFSN